MKVIPALNLIILLFCITIGIITPIYYKINKIIGHTVYYFFKYFECGMAFEYLAWATVESTHGVPPDNHIRDRYYFFFYPFFFLQFVRLWIIKESYLFLIVHLCFIYYFFKDLHLFYTYTYLLTVTNK